MTDRTPEPEELSEAAACRLKHGDTVYFTVSHDDSGEFMLAHCAVCGALRPEFFKEQA